MRGDFLDDNVDKSLTTQEMKAAHRTAKLSPPRPSPWVAFSVKPHKSDGNPTYKAKPLFTGSAQERSICTETLILCIIIRHIFDNYQDTKNFVISKESHGRKRQLRPGKNVSGFTTSAKTPYQNK
jgi:hypothetical protein